MERDTEEYINLNINIALEGEGIHNIGMCAENINFLEKPSSEALDWTVFELEIPFSVLPFQTWKKNGQNIKLY